MVEDIMVCGYPKVLATQIVSHSLPDSDKPMADVIADLQEAYSYANPQVCDFLGPFDCAAGEVMELPWEVGPDLRVHPNPLQAATKFSFELPQRGFTCVRIYGVNGEVLRTLVNRPLDAGRHAMTWDGRDNHGRPVPCGIYAVRLESGGQARTGKVLVTR
jgi:hypothetical protein